MNAPKLPIDLSIIMPALNEEENISSAIGHTREAFSAHGISGEIVVVNDGSTDRTPEIVEEILGREGEGMIRLVHHRTPQGLGAAFRDGLKEARGEAVAFMPGDDENDPGEIMRYYGLLSQVDMVVPFVYNKEIRPKVRNLISGVFRMIVNLSFGVNFNYTNGTVLYRRAILSSTPNRSNGFFFQTENVVRAVWNGYLFAEVPYRLAIRGGGESKAISLRSLRQVAGDYLALFREIYFPPASVAARCPVPGTVSASRRNETLGKGLARPGRFSRE